MESVIEARNLTKRYGEIEALRGVDLDVPKGITALIGPNGAGKTTLIKIIVGKLKPDSGDFRVLGIHDAMEIRENVGIVHDRVSFPPELSVDFFLNRIGEIYHTGPKSVKDIMNMCGLEGVKDQEIGTLSLGYTKRLGIAQAIVHEPQLVIADEPFTQLDPMTRIKLRDLFLRLKKDSGINFLISSHDILDMEQITNHFVIMSRGRIIREGDDFSIGGVLIKAAENNALIEYLGNRGVDAFENGSFVKVANMRLNDTLRHLIEYQGEIQEIKTSSLESIMRDAISE